MRAICWNGVNDVRAERVPDPGILNAQDAIVRVRLSSMCGSDLHLLGGYIPAMQAGRRDRPRVHRRGRRDRPRGPSTRWATGWWCVVHRLRAVLVLLAASCSRCATTATPTRRSPRRCCGQTPAASRLLATPWAVSRAATPNTSGCPFADSARSPCRRRSRRAALFASDAAADRLDGRGSGRGRPGDVVAVWGCGGVGQMAARGALPVGAERVIAIDRLPERLAMTERHIGAETLDYAEPTSAPNCGS